jgi:hypothetical protein
VKWVNECVVSGFRRGVHEFFALLGRYAAETVLAIPCRSHRQGSTVPWPLKMRPISCPETSITNYKYALLNISKEQRFRFTKWLWTDQNNFNGCHPVVFQYRGICIYVYKTTKFFKICTIIYFSLMHGDMFRLVVQVGLKMSVSTAETCRHALN